MTDAQFIAWLKSDDRMHCVLVEAGVNIGGTETTVYYGSRGYVTSSTDAPANQLYAPVIKGGVTIREELPVDGSASLAFGDVELNNVDGSLDNALTWVWSNRTVNIYVGDMRWVRSDFRLVFSGLIDDISSRSRDTLNLKVRDKLQQLNTALSQTKLGGTTQNADRLIPLTFGECHNITPLLVDKATLKYQWHNGAAERMIEVRDNGVPVSATANLTAGTFTLNKSPAGAITASVQGAKPGGTYTNTVANLVSYIVQNYGTTPFTGTDLDSTQLSAFNTANPQAVGIYITDRVNVIEVCQELAASIGAQLAVSALGKLRLLKISLPATGTPTAVGEGNMLEKTLRASDRPSVLAGVKLGYCRNWTVQTNLITGIPSDDKDLFAQEWLTKTATDATTATLYKLTKEPDEVDTLMLVGTDASTEATRRLNLWNTPRTVYEYTALAELMLEELGNYQTLTSQRFNMSSGVTGQIVAIQRDWLKARVDFGVLV